MVTAIVLSFLLAGACVLIAFLLFKGADTMLAEVAPTVKPEDWAAVARDFSAVIGPSTGPSTPASKSRPTAAAETRIRLVSNTGKTVRDITVARRRVSVQYRVGKGLRTFMASHQDGDVWVYRQVGTERD